MFTVERPRMEGGREWEEGLHGGEGVVAAVSSGKEAVSGETQGMGKRC